MPVSFCIPVSKPFEQDASIAMRMLTRTLGMAQVTPGVTLVILRQDGVSYTELFTAELYRKFIQEYPSIPMYTASMEQMPASRTVIYIVQHQKGQGEAPPQWVVYVAPPECAAELKAQVEQEEQAQEGEAQQENNNTPEQQQRLPSPVLAAENDAVGIPRLQTQSECENRT